MSKKMRKSTDFEKKVFEYLQDLRSSGEINMFESPSRIVNEFDLSMNEAISITSLWMTNFNENGDYDEILA